ncbi:iron chelate uptake ABC transporter family permease subunit [Sulfitobacter faviae]|uniref:Iron chelate uptake ABC transporter family permease subunit n=1 Tax=Sulfitobacter faviae TaxID=1775881 RepID=A0ABZ0UXL1_9RHOB|nr:iron chelate uptake ABC transporter family permease subunit [Sulfitobacter faviae]WPZ21348.1 iron chelate uptake ABC transporter family permease subunit [Sulfitobacter faviae]
MSDVTITAPRRFRPAATRRVQVLVALAALVSALMLLTLSCGRGCLPPGDVWAALRGAPGANASFVVTDLRLPRAVMGLLAGASFGLGGVAFQIMLRNPLASPDIIGISASAGAAAVFAIVILALDGWLVSLVAVAAGLGVAAMIWALSSRRGAAGARLILIGIGVSAMLDSVTAYVLLEAPAWDRAEAMRWLTGSLNGMQLVQALPVAGALLVFGGLLAVTARDLEVLRLGDDTAEALGVRADATRLRVTLAAVGLVAIATAATGPIAFVAFLSGPIAARLLPGPTGLLLGAGLVGALLVIAGDFVGQFLLPARLPVGVVTGAVGAPFLLYLIVRANRNGGTL